LQLLTDTRVSTDHFETYQQDANINTAENGGTVIQPVEDKQDLPKTHSDWGDLSNSLLCAGLSARQIREALTAAFPGFHWFLLVQPLTGSFTYSMVDEPGIHIAVNTCGRNMFVWRSVDRPDASCYTNLAAQVLAQHLVDSAVAQGSTPSAIQDFILGSEDTYLLTHILTVSFTYDDGEYSSWLWGDCAAFGRETDGLRAFYYIMSGPTKGESKIDGTLPLPANSDPKLL